LLLVLLCFLLSYSPVLHVASTIAPPGMGKRRNKAQKRPAPQRPKKPLPPEAPHQSALGEWWTRIPTWVKAAVVGATLLITLLEGWPWLSVDEQSFLNPSNPYSQMFKVINTGYLPVTDLGAQCRVDFTDQHQDRVNDVTGIYPHFADYLAHDGQATIPCFRLVETNQVNAGASLNIVISHDLFYVGSRFLRKSQTFRF
jgi:hypothetical protein